MALVIRRRYDVECAHHLTAGVPGDHKCRRLHGHRYEIEIAVSGGIDRDGMIIEYDTLDAAVLPILDLIDHRDLNTLADRCASAEAMEVSANPTVERLASWLVGRLARAVATGTCGLEWLTVREDARSAVEWRP